MEGVELGFVERSLRALDVVSGEVIVGWLGEAERPPRGVAGLVDWRVGSCLTQECLRGFLTGARGEKLLLPTRRLLPFQKALVVGLGGPLDEESFKNLLELVLDALEAMRVRRAAVELPGRHLDAIPLPRALELLWSSLDERTGSLESLLVIEDREHQKLVEASKIRPARRTRAGLR